MLVFAPRRVFPARRLRRRLRHRRDRVAAAALAPPLPAALTVAPRGILDEQRAALRERARPHVLRPEQIAQRAKERERHCVAARFGGVLLRRAERVGAVRELIKEAADRAEHKSVRDFRPDKLRHRTGHVSKRAGEAAACEAGMRGMESVGVGMCEREV